MSLRMRLFAMLGGLVALLVFVQWWWVRGLTRDLTAEVGEVAVWVGNNVATALVEERREPCVGPGCGQVILTTREIARQGTSVTTGERVFVFKKDRPVGDDTPPSRWVTAEGAESDADALAEMREQLEHQGFRVRMGAEDDGERTSLVAVHDFEIVMAPTERDRHMVLRLHTDHGGHAAPGVSRSAAPDAEVSRAFERRIPIPAGGVEAKLERFSRRLWLGSAGLLGLGLVLAAVIAHRVATPLRRLSSAAERVGAGELGAQVTDAGGDVEVSRAIAAFNHMSSRLAVLDARARTVVARQHLSEIGEIARGLAHTLRNPLNALGLSVDELVTRTSSGADAEQLGASARRQIRRLDQGIRSFLTLASQGGGVTEPVDIVNLARDVALEASQDTGGRSVAVEVDAPEAMPRLPAIAAELRAVLQALVVNAIDASPDDAAVRVALSTDGSERGDVGAHRDAHSGVRVDITDRGSGLVPAVRERLFTPHLSTKAHGSGMGLFLAQRIATTRYGGSLALEDRPGGGTRATLCLHPRRDEVTLDER